jgi:glutamyl/glutaminyl-tRNA synthetase
LRPTLATFDQVAAQAEPVFHAGGPLDDEARAAVSGEEAKRVLAALASSLAHRSIPDAAAWAALRAELQAATTIRGRALLQPLRVALTGRAHGRELDRLLPLSDSGHRALPDRVPALDARARRTLEGLA